MGHSPCTLSSSCHFTDLACWLAPPRLLTFALHRHVVAMAAGAAVLDENGLPMAYDRQAIQKYWDTRPGEMQQRWSEFLGESVPFLSKLASILISSGLPGLQACSPSAPTRLSCKQPLAMW